MRRKKAPLNKIKEEEIVSGGSSESRQRKPVKRGGTVKIQPTAEGESESASEQRRPLKKSGR
jgi:hypothetical protein